MGKFRLVLLFFIFVKLDLAGATAVDFFKVSTPLGNYTAGYLIAQAPNGTVALLVNGSRSPHRFQIIVKDKNDALLYSSPERDSVPTGAFSLDASKLYFTINESRAGAQLNVVTLSTGKIESLGDTPLNFQGNVKILPTHRGDCLIFVSSHQGELQTIRLFSLAKNQVVAEINSFEMTAGSTSRVLFDSAKLRQDDILVLHQNSSVNFYFGMYRVSSAGFQNISNGGPSKYNKGRLLDAWLDDRSIQNPVDNFDPWALVDTSVGDRMSVAAVGIFQSIVSPTILPFSYDNSGTHGEQGFRLLSNTNAIGFVLTKSGNADVGYLVSVDFYSHEVKTIYTFDPDLGMAGKEFSISDDGKFGNIVVYDHATKFASRVVFLAN